MDISILIATTGLVLGAWIVTILIVRHDMQERRALRAEMTKLCDQFQLDIQTARKEKESLTAQIQRIQDQVQNLTMRFK